MIAAEASRAWPELEARLRPYVARRVASSFDVDDVIQEVFVRIHRGLDDLRDGQSFGGWVYRIAERAVVDHQRSRARHPLPRAAAALDGEAPPPTHDDDLAEDLTGCIALFVARLPSPYREAITLTELEGITQKDAAEMLGISLSGMKSRIQRGRARIRAMFEECCVVSVDARGRVVDCTARPLDQVPEDCRAAARAWEARRGG